MGFELSTKRIWAGVCRGAMANRAMVPLLHHAPLVVVAVVDSVDVGDRTSLDVP